MATKKATAFLDALYKTAPAPAKKREAEPAPPAEPQPAAPAAAPPSVVKRKALKHVGGYLDEATVEKLVLLRVRLKLDNSALITMAIEELYRKHEAKRAFGDA